MNQFKEKAEKLSSSKEVSDGQLKLLQEQVTELRKLNTKVHNSLFYLDKILNTIK